ncbi:hypothetical protein MKX03_025169 [Papaver bracteatum]|nr:hypothetical protein MKX03_025169 [Papaver bracteatum]
MDFTQTNSASVGFLLFAGIIGFSLMLQITSAQNPYTCWMGGTTKVATNYHLVSGYGTEAKCTAVLRECADLCKSQGKIVKWDICQWYTNTEVYACTACCGLAASSPPPSPSPPCHPPPSPPPPSPPPPPKDKCNAGDIYRTYGAEDCSFCEEYCSSVCTEYEHFPGTTVGCRISPSYVTCDCCCLVSKAAA